MREKITLVLFCAMIFLVPVVSLAKADTFYSEQEKRNLMQKEEILPGFRVKKFYKKKYYKKYYKNLDQKIENYLTDQFPARDRWITVKTLSELAAGKRGNFFWSRTPMQILLPSLSWTIMRKYR